MVSGLQCTLDPDTCDPTDMLTEQAVEFCQRVGSRSTRVSEIVGQKDEAVYRAIEEGIQRVNGNAAARPYHIQKWAILERDFSISGGELGRLVLLLYSPVPGAGWEGGQAGPGVAWQEAAVPGSAGVATSYTWEDTAQCLAMVDPVHKDKVWGRTC